MLACHVYGHDAIASNLEMLNQTVRADVTDCVASEVKPHSWNIFTRKPRTYPNALACLGKKIGDFEERTWWHATGTARTAFDVAEDEIRQHLEKTFRNKYPSMVYFHLFMIGKSEELAIPTIMFFCDDKKPRQEAKEAIDKSWLRDKLPGFRTGHYARQPNFGSLIQPANTDELEGGARKPIINTDVYFNPLFPIRALGMPVFVSRREGDWARATAYAVFKQDQCLMVTVSHIFIEEEPEASAITSDEKDFDFGSDSESEMGELVNVRTSHKQTIPPKISLQHPDPSNAGKDLTQSTSAHPDPIHGDQGSTESLPTTPYHRLGTLQRSSFDEDWALIDITHENFASNLRHDWQAQQKRSFVAARNEEAPAVVYTSGQEDRLYGTLSNMSLSLRLPWSSTFQEVYQIMLDHPIDWGDCGSVVLDAKTRAFYGHVVASSEDRQIVFIIPAARLLDSTGTIWQTPEVADNSNDSATAGQRSPKFFFRIDEFSQDPNYTMSHGNGLPNSQGLYVRRPGHGITGQWWICDGNQTRSLPSWHPPQGSTSYSVFSTMFIEGHGFCILRGDAMNPSDDEAWHNLRFDHDEMTGPSALTNAGQDATLLWQNPKSRWPHMLLPSIYHAPKPQGNPNPPVEADAPGDLGTPEEENILGASNAQEIFGGLTGDLPIFLALLAFSMKPERLATELPRLMNDGRWRTHSRSHGRIHQRGVIVYVYAYNDNHQQLNELEYGRLGMYYE